jgi:hypothetical protein
MELMSHLHMTTERLKDPHLSVNKISDSQGFTIPCKLCSHLWTVLPQPEISNFLGLVLDFEHNIQVSHHRSMYFEQGIQLLYYITDFVSHRHSHPYLRKPTPHAPVCLQNSMKTSSNHPTFDFSASHYLLQYQ